MKSIIATCAAVGLAALLLGATSESPDAGIPIEQIIATVAHQSGKRFLVDPRVQARVHIIGQDVSNISYSDLLTILQLHGFPAGFLVPIPRPMMPQVAQLAAAYCSNSLLIVDSFDNVKRIEAIVKTLDVGTAYKPAECTMPNPGDRHEPAPKRNVS